MSDLIVLPPEILAWLRQLAQARDFSDGWDEGEPYPVWEELLAAGLIEYRPAAFRLTELGWWVLGRAVAEGEQE